MRGVQAGQSAALPEGLDLLEEVIAKPDFDTQLTIKVRLLPHTPLIAPSSS
jgi:hypothetical protein